VPPLNLYAETIALQRASATKGHPVNLKISGVANAIWGQTANNGRAAGASQPRRQRRADVQPRPQTGLEKLRERAAARERDVAEAEETRRNQRRGNRAAEARRQRGGSRDRGRPNGRPLITKWAEAEWKKRWEKAGEGKNATTWCSPWDAKTLPLYEGLTKHQATALFLLRTEVLGLNAWLASIQVPDILPRCPCGWQAQTVRHILLHCPNYASERPRLIAQTRTENLREMLSKPESAKAAAKWFVRQGVLEQFNTAREIEAEDAAQYVPFQELDSWT
jgi:hypothetical protein